MTSLVQPLFTREPEPGHSGCEPLLLQQFIELIKEEEDYWPGEQTNTKLTISRLRKIFYDKWGWDDQLIRGAAKIEGRYNVDILDKPADDAKKMRWYKNESQHPKYRRVTYKASDKVFPELAGLVPKIYDCNHQEVILPDGHCCDIGHVLAGIDAYNHKAVVGPLPWNLNDLRLFPYVESNEDIVTWLGDIASSGGDFFFYHIDNKPALLPPDTAQGYINTDAPGSDMLGNIDAFVIARMYDVKTSNGGRFSEILKSYYLGNHTDPPFRNNRCKYFCQAVGLTGWNGNNFSNETEWIKYYRKQLRDNICFQVFSLTDGKLQSLWRVLKIWLNFYTNIIRTDELLGIWLHALKEGLKKETALPLKPITDESNPTN
jgi:hypothetical protein